MVDGAGANAKAREPDDRGEPLSEEEVLDRNPAHAVADGPGGERLRRIVGPDHEAGAESVRRGHGASRRVEADDLEPAAIGGAPVALADPFRGTPGKDGIGVRLDLDLHGKVSGRRLEQLV
jgi:hypothetical protein